ncbi:Conserved_hypothetical protein [Hexamita inflata]|uniref:Uncharacterized protein n=1 Tax=Hexamita inflata TaxID=28002 RepID=A0AA86UZP4_9EUKA|nr:Conserved hypothetical protein [Hexamita inflata]
MQLLENWQQIVCENFFELNEQSMPEILSTFHQFLCEAALDEHQQLQFVTLAARQIQLPPLEKLDNNEITQYTTLINMLVPNLASESAYISSFALAFFPRLAVVLSTAQLGDLISNLVSAFEVYCAGSIGLSATCALICLYTIASELLFRLDNLHIGLLQLTKSILRQLKSTKQLGALQIAFESLSAQIIFKVLHSLPFKQVSKADDVSLITQFLAEFLSTLKQFQFRTTSTFIILLKSARELSVVNSLLRVPNYLSAILSLMGGILIKSEQIEVKNEVRGFLVQVLVLDWFISEGGVDRIINTFKCEIKEEEDVKRIREVVMNGYQQYVEQYGVPVRAAVPVKF